LNPDPRLHDDAPPARPRRVRLVDVEPALCELLHEWLVDVGTEPLRSAPAPVQAGQAEQAADPARCELVITTVHYPRQSDALALRQLAARHGDAPVLVLSPTFFAGIDCHGPVAQALGVAGVLPQPVARDALQAAVRRLLALPRAEGTA
jgi:DNA-binding NarL/FixJ family response regulator